MPRIDTRDDRRRWRYKCPECSSENWRCNDGNFECRRCGAKSVALRDDKSDKLVHRREFEFVGTHASDKAAFES